MRPTTLHGKMIVDTESSALIDFGGVEAVWVPKEHICDINGYTDYTRTFTDDMEEDFLIDTEWAKQVGLI